jgi:hypothetical protein
MKEMTEMWGGGWKNGASRCQVSERVVLKRRERMEVQMGERIRLWNVRSSGEGRKMMRLP